MKLDRIEDILVECLEDIKAGRSSLEECLDRHPLLRERLEPLLRIALDIREPPDLKPSPHFKTKARVWLMDEISLRQSAGRRLWSCCCSQMRLMPLMRRFSMAGVIIAVVLALSAAGWGAAYASQSSLPGDTLYRVKLATEQVRMGLTADDTARAERALGFADRRIEEMKALADRGRAEHLGRAAEKYDDAMDMALALVDRAAVTGLVTGNVTARLAEVTSRHLRVLDELHDMVPDQARPAIVHARNVSQTGHLRALSALGQDQPERAAEINLLAIEERLTRASDAAQAYDGGEVSDALGRFEEMSRLGAQIAAYARQLGGHEEERVGELLAGATYRHLLVLDDVADMATGEALQAVARARYEVLKRHREELTALSERDSVMATELNLRAMEGRLDRIRVAFGSTEAVGIALEQFDAMAACGEEISKAAQRVGTDEEEVELMIAMATLLHVETLAEIWEAVPEQAREAVEIVMARVLIRHENRVHAMEEKGVEIPGVGVMPSHVRERVEERMRQQRIWDEREAALVPGIPGSVSGCPGCRRP